MLGLRPSSRDDDDGVLRVLAAREARDFGVAEFLRVFLLLLTTHVGGTAFVTVPEATLPRLLGGFTVGGPLEWPVLWQAAAIGANATPTLVFKGPKGQAQPVSGDIPYGSLQQTIQSVS